VTPLEVAEQATGLFSVSWLLIAIPGVVALFLLAAGKITNAWGHLVGVLAPVASFVLALLLFIQLLGRGSQHRSVNLNLYDWIDSGRWHITAGLQIDQLSIVFALLITFVGSLIIIYSVGYMAHDPNRRRFFGYMNLFITAMLLLVLANNYFALFVGWEGVGLASYLLIGFWQERPSAATAAKKAFVVNRVGDLGMSIGLAFMLYLFGSVQFTDVNAGAPKMTFAQATILGLLLLLAACGKSAQVPLQSWLLDAMEGPTPVSALIHAATMVTAGVYLIVRSHAIFAQTGTASLVVAIVGTVTLLAGAWIGCAKDDIKRVLAGSTMSQIGYMMLAAGIGPAGYAFAIFHLVTHGFFKANMFLGAGSVMHATNEEVNMRRYGGLSRLMPITFVTFGIGYLAIIGFPFLDGYYSKDHIIDAAWEHNKVMGVLALIGAGVTGFYMTRLMIMTFFGAKRYRDSVHPHEAPPIMTVPLILLAIGSAFAGLLLNDWIAKWLDPAVGVPEPANVPGVLSVNVISLITLLTVAIGVGIAILVFGRGKEIPVEQPASRSPFTLAGRNDLYGDAINETLFMRPGIELVRGVTRTDTAGVDGSVMSVSGMIAGLSVRLRRWQSGFVRSYALTMIAGAFLIGFVLVLVRLG
jgi:NADH-quinone oxidoreductase subunit L